MIEIEIIIDKILNITHCNGDKDKDLYFIINDHENIFFNKDKNVDIINFINEISIEELQDFYQNIENGKYVDCVEYEGLIDEEKEKYDYIGLGYNNGFDDMIFPFENDCDFSAYRKKDILKKIKKYLHKNN